MEKQENATVENEKEEKDMVVVFSKPYTFEGKVYESIDLSGLENIKASDMIKVDKVLNKDAGFAIMPELSLEYACHIAEKITDQPIEFFLGLPPKAAIALKNKVTSFFFGQD